MLAFGYIFQVTPYILNQQYHFGGKPFAERMGSIKGGGMERMGSLTKLYGKDGFAYKAIWKGCVRVKDGEGKDGFERETLVSLHWFPFFEILE